MGKKEPRFDKYVDWALMTLLSAIASYVAQQASEITHNMQDLNKKVAVVIEKVSDQDRRLLRLEKVVFKR